VGLFVRPISTLLTGPDRTADILMRRIPIRTVVTKVETPTTHRSPDLDKPPDREMPYTEVYITGRFIREGGLVALGTARERIERLVQACPNLVSLVIFYGDVGEIGVKRLSQLITEILPKARMSIYDESRIGRPIKHGDSWEVSEVGYDTVPSNQEGLKMGRALVFNPRLLPQATEDMLRQSLRDLASPQHIG
jgi:hypothetical protein